MIDATPDEQRHLLQVQQLDSRMARLRRRASTPAGPQAADVSAEELRRLAREMTSAADLLDALRAVPATVATSEAVRSAQEAMAGLRRRGEALAAEHRQLAAAAADAPAKLAAALTQARSERAALTATIPGRLLDAYQAARRRLPDPAIAPVTDGRTCGGCHLAIPALELDAARQASATRLPECPECDRLLVFEPIEPVD